MKHGFVTDIPCHLFLSTSRNCYQTGLLPGSNCNRYLKCPSIPMEYRGIYPYGLVKHCYENRISRSTLVSWPVYRIIFIQVARHGQCLSWEIIVYNSPASLMPHEPYVAQALVDTMSVTRCFLGYFRTFYILQMSSTTSTSTSTPTPRYD